MARKRGKMDAAAKSFARTTSTAARLVAVLLMIGLVVTYIALGVAMYPIVDERLGSWFTVIMFTALMFVILNLFIPPYSFIASLWLYGDPKRQARLDAEAARQRNNLELMTARSRERYGDEGPPESMSGDESTNRVKNRDAGAGRSRKG